MAEAQTLALHTESSDDEFFDLCQVTAVTAIACYCKKLYDKHMAELRASAKFDEAERKKLATALVEAQKKKLAYTVQAGKKNIANLEVEEEKRRATAGVMEAKKKKRPAAEVGAEKQTKKKKRKWVRDKKKRIWVRDEWACREGEEDAEANLVPELRSEDREAYRHCLCMSEQDFEELLEKIRPKIEKEDTVMRDAIPAKTRLEVALTYLATGSSYLTISQIFKIPPCTISYFMLEVVSAIIEALGNVFHLPKTQTEWEVVEKQFWDEYQLPNCVGAVVGKHVVIKRPPNMGNEYYNYKGTHSFILLAVVDAHCRIMFADVSNKGSVCDGAVLGQALHGNLNLPPPRPLPGPDTSSLPFYFIGDESFSLSQNFMRPYQLQTVTEKEEAYNNRVKMAQMVVDCTFNIMTQRFKLLSRPIETRVALARKSVMAIVCLYNFLTIRHPLTQSKNYASYTNEHGLSSSDTIVTLHPLLSLSQNQAGEAVEQQNTLRDWLHAHPLSEQPIDGNYDNDAV